jgi:hypothetical protein
MTHKSEMGLISFREMMAQQGFCSENTRAGEWAVTMRKGQETLRYRSFFALFTGDVSQ